MTYINGSKRFDTVEIQRQKCDDKHVIQNVTRFDSIMEKMTTNYHSFFNNSKTTNPTKARPFKSTATRGAVAGSPSKTPTTGGMVQWAEKEQNQLQKPNYEHQPYGEPSPRPCEKIGIKKNGLK